MNKEKVSEDSEQWTDYQDYLLSIGEQNGKTMNRQYKFRGKALSTGQWVYGAIYEHLPPLQCFIDEQKEPSKWYILKTGFADWNMPRDIETIEVDPDTVGQWTGKLDTEGKEIYEGDRVYFHTFINRGYDGLETDYEGSGIIEYRLYDMSYVIADKERAWTVEETTEFENPCIRIINEADKQQ